MEASPSREKLLDGGEADRRTLIRRTAVGAAAIGGLAATPGVRVFGAAPAHAQICSPPTPPCSVVETLIITGPALLTALGFELPAARDVRLESDATGCASMCSATLGLNSPDLNVNLALTVVVDGLAQAVAASYDPTLPNPDIVTQPGGYVVTVTIPCSSGDPTVLQSVTITSPFNVELEFEPLEFTPC